MQNLVSAEELADVLNKLPLSNPMWGEGGFRVAGRWLEIDPDASDELAAWMLKCDIETARQRNDAEARWFVAGGVGVVYVDGAGWKPVPRDWAMAHNAHGSASDDGAGTVDEAMSDAPVVEDVPV